MWKAEDNQSRFFWVLLAVVLVAWCGEHTLAGQPGFFSNLPLCKAVQMHDLSGIKRLLNKGCAIDALDSRGATALDYAASSGGDAMVRLLLEHGAKPNAGKWPILSAAIQDGDFDMVKVLVDHGADVNAKMYIYLPPPIVVACLSGSKGEAAFLIAHGAKVNVCTKTGSPLACAASAGRLDIIHLLLEKGAKVNGRCLQGQTPLFGAVQFKSLRAVRALIQAGADVNAKDKNGDTPYMTAVRLNEIDILRVLIAHGADLNYCCNVLWTGWDGHVHQEAETALMMACRVGALDAVQALIKAGAPLEAVPGTRGLTPLMVAAGHGRESIAELLIQHGAKVNARYIDGSTALMRAVRSGDSKLVEMFLEKGADPSIKDNKGKTAIEYAKELGDQYMVTALKSTKGLRK